MAKFSAPTQMRMKEKTDWFTLLASTAGVAAALRVKHETVGNPGMILLVKISAAATLSLTPRLETVDDGGNTVILWSAAAAIIANGTYVYIFHEHGATDANGAGVTAKIAMPIPREWQLFLDTTAGSSTIEVHACYL